MLVKNRSFCNRHLPAAFRIGTVLLSNLTIAIDRPFRPSMVEEFAITAKDQVAGTHRRHEFGRVAVMRAVLGAVKRVAQMRIDTPEVIEADRVAGGMASSFYS
jgi:hypothetical protein